jgi:hypothetical protein
VALSSRVLKVAAWVDKIWISLYTQNGKDKNRGHGMVIKTRTVEPAGTCVHSYVVMGVEAGLNEKPEGS